MPFETIIVERDKNVGFLTINRPASMNALCAAFMGEAARALADFGADESIRVLVVKGLPDCFAAGTDMSDLTSSANRAEFAEGVKAFDAFPKPIVAAVNGYAFGGGLELVLKSDVVIAADDARFGFPEITLGVLPQMGGAAALARRIGRARAADLLLTARQMSAEEALSCGLVSRVVEADSVVETAAETARRIASMPVAGTVLVRQVLEKAEENDSASALSVARLSLFSDDAKEGLAALRENRAPNFSQKAV